MVILQGDLVWVQLRSARGSEPAGRRPAVVLQHDRFNRTLISTVVVAAVTSQTKYANLVGNVLLRKGEAGLNKASVINVTQIATIDRAYVVEKIGRISTARLNEIWSGLKLVLEPPEATRQL